VRPVTPASRLERAGVAGEPAARTLYFARLDNTVSEFEQRLGHAFQQPELLRRALTHKSYSHEAREHDVRHNETYEFLGDSVLGFVIGDLLFRHFPQLDEGALSKMKAFLVSAPSLAAKARDYGMGEVILLGVGEEKTGGRKKDSLLANLFEAVIAAVYLDSGIDAARQLIERTFNEDIGQIDQQDLLFRDFKTALQEAAQGRGLQLPEYSVIEEVGPDHDKTFIVEVRLGNLVARGEGSSKKEAQQQAARQALRDFGERYGT
jgi:ribonuclease-3